MKTATFKTDRAEIMIVEVPEKEIPISVEDNILTIEKKPQTFYQFDLKDNYIELGFISKLTEEMVEPLVEKYNFGTEKNPQIEYLDYVNEKFICVTALESFLSLLETKVYWENPYEIYRAYTPEHFKEWEELYNDAQSRTFDKARTLVLVKEK